MKNRLQLLRLMRETTDEGEFVRAFNEVTDAFMKPFLYIVLPAGIVAILTHLTRGTGCPL